MLAFNAAHAPKENAIEAFKIVLPKLKAEIVKWRHHWDAHEPRMWERAQALADHDLVGFTIEDDLVEVRFQVPAVTFQYSVCLLTSTHRIPGPKCTHVLRDDHPGEDQTAQSQ